MIVLYFKGHNYIFSGTYLNINYYKLLCEMWDYSMTLTFTDLNKQMPYGQVHVSSPKREHTVGNNCNPLFLPEMFRLSSDRG